MTFFRGFFFLATFIIFIATSCKKTSFITSPDASIQFSSDTLRFDTVFTTTGSVTGMLKVLNNNSQKLMLSEVKLMGGSASSFKLNVDGMPGTSFNKIALEGNDSLYIFVSVTINPNSANLPFIVTDSILVSFNGNNRYIQLQAYGQNANFFYNRRITRDSTWNNDRPYVIVGGLTVDSGVTLNIAKGSRIFCHANAPFTVNGSLKTNGEAHDTARIIFRGDRLDNYYKDIPAAWPGIYFSQSSVNNVLNYTTVRNAYQGLITQSSISANPKIILNQCIIDNIYDAGIVSLASSIKAVNCLISNCGSNIIIAAGGFYSFDHCTAVSYSNLYIDHKNPVLYVTNTDENGTTYPMTARFRNCIFYGEGVVKNEVVVDKANSSSAFNVAFQNVLYKNEDESFDNLFVNSIKNQMPEFESIDPSRQIFNFHLKETSPAIGRGLEIGVQVDLDGIRRTLGTPDIGCYQH
jgi:hypothetical protein